MHCRFSVRKFVPFPLWFALFLLTTTCGLAQQIAGASQVEKLSVKVQAKVAPQGALEMDVRVTATEGLGKPYFDAYFTEGGQGPVNATKLYGTFLRNRLMPAKPTAKVSTDPTTIEVQFPLREEDFVLPVTRSQPLQLDVLPPFLFPGVAPDKRLHLGALGIQHEEIVFDIPKEFAIPAAERNVKEERSFARYRSDATVVDGKKLLVVREFEILVSTMPESAQTEVAAFWKVMQMDRERPFLLRRTARQDFTEWIQNVPVGKLNPYGNRAVQQGEFEVARELLERATRATPKSANAWNNLGRALAGLGRNDEAEKAYLQQIAVNPKDIYTYNNLALLNERQGRWDQAVQNLRKQLEINPADQYAVPNFPRALIHQGMWAEAEDAAAIAVKALPTNVIHKVEFAVVQVCLGKVTNARREIDSAMGSRPTPGAWNLAATYLTFCGKELQLAEEYITKALDQTASQQDRILQADAVQFNTPQLNPLNLLNLQSTRADFLDTYGALLLKIDKPEWAEKALLSSVGLTPRGETFGRLAQAEWKLGKRDLAATHWREAIMEAPGLLTQVPEELGSRLPQVPPLSMDGRWFALEAKVDQEAEALVRDGKPVYFFVTANADGRVQLARPVDKDSAAAKKAQPGVYDLAFPVVLVGGEPVATAHIVRIAKRDGKVTLSHSVGSEAASIASEFSFVEFP